MPLKRFALLRKIPYDTLTTGCPRPFRMRLELLAFNG
jgi:hypothetical protein